MADFTIRQALADDLETIVEYNQGLAQETEGKTLDSGILRQGVATALEDPDRLRYWVAEVIDDETGTARVIGQAGVTREWSDWRNGFIWWFQSVYVHPDYRGAGIFRALHAEIRAAARQDPEVIGLRLYVEVENHKAQRVYQSLGMKPGGYDVYEELWIGSNEA
jgi:RimJ/RimL family protein N-acetyltransferase